MSCLLVFKECVLISFACRYPILSDMLLLLLCGRLHTHECGSLLIFFSSGLHPAAQTVALDKYSDDEQEKKVAYCNRHRQRRQRLILFWKDICLESMGKFLGSAFYWRFVLDFKMCLWSKIEVFEALSRIFVKAGKSQLRLLLKTPNEKVQHQHGQGRAAALPTHDQRARGLAANEAGM